MNGVPGLQQVALADVAALPWKNGGGRTRELLAWPRAGAWSLRVSVADVEADGPFSAFPGVERWFTVIDGAGVVLALPGGSMRVVRGDPPLRFDGAVAPGCRCIDGRTCDLNLMVRQDAGRGQMREAAAGDAWASPARWRGVYAADACRLQVQVDGHMPADLPLPAGTLAWHPAAASQVWRLQPLDAKAPRAWWLAFDEQAGVS